MLRPILACLPNLTVDSRFVEVRDSVGAGVVISRRLGNLTFGAIPLVFISKFNFRISYQAGAMPVSSSPDPRLLRGFEDRFSIRFCESVARYVFWNHSNLYQQGNVSAIKHPTGAFNRCQVFEWLVTRDRFRGGEGWKLRAIDSAV